MSERILCNGPEGLFYVTPDPRSPTGYRRVPPESEPAPVIPLSTIIVLPAGPVAYDMNDAVIPIDDMIDLLESAKGEGATHVVGGSGNHRGARWQHLARMYDWADDEQLPER